MSVVTAIIKAKGKEISAMYELISLEVSNSINDIPYARLIFQDGDPAMQRFEISESDDFNPGNQVEIQLRYEGRKNAAKTVFKGVVLEQRLDIDANESALTIELSGKAYKLTQSKNEKALNKPHDWNLVNDVISDAGIQVMNIPRLGFHVDTVTRYYASDWDFISEWANKQELLVIVENEGISFKSLNDGGRVHTYEYGTSPIYDLSVSSDAILPQQSAAYGVLSCPGTADVDLMDLLELRKLSKRFNGKALIYHIEHVVDANGWVSHLSFGPME